MQVKCTSCGALQNINEKNICAYCGSNIELNNKVTANETAAFELAIYEYNKGNFTDAVVLFDEILKKDPNVLIAWMYKIFGNFYNNLKAYKNKLSWDDFQKDISFLVQKFNTEKNIAFLENNLIILLNDVFLRDYELGLPWPGNIFSLSKESSISAFFDIPEFLNQLSKILSKKISEQIINLLINFFKKFEYKDSYPSGIEIAYLDQLLLTDLNLAEKLITAILESNIKSLNSLVERQLKKESNKENDRFLYIPTDFELKNGDELIEFLARKSEKLNFQNLLNNYHVEISSIRKKIETLKIRRAFAEKNEAIAKKKRDGCFIATAVMNDYNDPVVMDLRQFRDEWLLKRRWGVTFTEWYYKHGPKAASIIERSILLKKITFFLIIKPFQIITKKIR